MGKRGKGVSVGSAEHCYRSNLSLLNSSLSLKGGEPFFKLIGWKPRLKMLYTVLSARFITDLLF
jgi:hypothetical protein